MDLYLTIGIIAIGIFLFVKDYFTIDTTSILIMALFIVAGVLSPEEGFSGFNHPATITLGCMFVVSAAVFKSGIIDGLSYQLIRIARIHYIVALIVFCLISALFSAFVNDAAVVAILIPIALSVCRESGIAPSKLLIPISFAALFGGTCTLIGTSTNILVSSIAQKSDLEPFGMFEFTLPALSLLAIGMLYLFVVAPFLLPKRKSEDAERLIQSENYITELIIPADCSDVGKEIKRAELIKKYTVKIISIYRNEQRLYEFDRDTVLQADDILKVAISPAKLGALKQSTAYHIVGSKELNKGEEDGKIIFETMVPIGSLMANSSLKGLKFQNNYNAAVIAIRQRNELIEENLSEVTIKEGDLLLIYTSREEMKLMLERNILILLSEHQKSKINYRKAIPALLIAFGVVTAAALDITSILISGMIGALLLITTSTLKPKEAYDAIEWKVIFMMAGVLSMGTALEKTGGAEIISDFVFNSLGDLDPR
ncbi:MAG: SLC13 family permease, partial [Vicingaceae bacterium]